jgi:hypothetical protein
MATVNLVNVLTNVAGFLMNQKDIAFYEASTYPEEDIFSKFGINTNQLLFGALSSAKEIFAGGKLLDGGGALTSVVNGISSFVTSTAIKNINVDRSSQVMRHPAEDGKLVADHVIYNPKTIVAEIAMPSYLYESVYKEIEEYFIQKKEVVVLTKLKSFRHMYVTKMPHAVNPKTIDRPSVTITLEEVLFSSNLVPSKSENQSTI